MLVGNGIDKIVEVIGLIEIVLKNDFTLFKILHFINGWRKVLAPI